MGGRELGEPHHQHRPDGEVRGDEAVRPGEPATELVDLVAAEAGGADDVVDAVLGTGSCVRERRFEDREVDGHLRSAVHEGVWSGCDDEIALDRRERSERLASSSRVDRRDELQVWIGVDRPTHLESHPPGGSEHRDAGHWPSTTCEATTAGSASTSHGKCPDASG